MNNFLNACTSDSGEVNLLVAGLNINSQKQWRPNGMPENLLSSYSSQGSCLGECKSHPLHPITIPPLAYWKQQYVQGNSNIQHLISSAFFNNFIWNTVSIYKAVRLKFGNQY